MKHAGSVALAGLSGLLDEIRERQGLKEKKLGIDRFPVNSRGAWDALLQMIDRLLKA